MLALKIFLMVIFGLAAGVGTAAGFFALIATIGLVNRYADETGTKNHIILYEEMIILGAVIGNVMFVFDIRVPLGMVGILLFGFLSGVFIGTFFVCLAETVKALPLLARRTNLKKGLGFLILSLALGKGAGHLLYYLFLYK